MCPASQFAEKYQVRQQNDLRQQVGNPQPGPNLENSLLATESPKMSFSANCSAAVFRDQTFVSKQKSLIAAMRLSSSKTGPAYTLNEDPQPHVLFTFGFSNLKPAPSRVST